jgi:hypothetical protein
MSDIETADTATPAEPFEPALLPENLAEVLQTIVADGNAARLDDDDTTIRTVRTGRPLIGCSIINTLAIVQAGLLGGERDRLITTHRGRYVARTGSLAGFDDTITDAVGLLASWARGEIDLLEQELIEAIDAKFGWPATSRKDALKYLVERGEVSADEARADIEESE